MSDLIKRLHEADLSAIKKACEILDGLPQDAIDGGWTARGISAYAKQLESDLAFQKQVTDAARQHQAELLERAEMAETQIAAAEKQEPVAWKIDGLNEYNESAPGVWLKKGNADASASMLFRSTVTPLYAHPLQSDAEGRRKDAERYRLLRDFGKDGVNIKPPCEHVHACLYSHPTGSIPATRVIAGAELDAAIDAALAKQQDQS
jgi:hypothetical protein